MEEKEEVKPKTLFCDLQSEVLEPEASEIESLCPQCRQNGTTRYMLTKIPFFKDVVVISFSCSHCGYENSELQAASKIQEKGVRYTLQVTSQKDLSRQIVKTEWATVNIPHLEFETVARSQEGMITTLEGIISRAITGLSSYQNSLRTEDDEAAKKFGDFLTKFRNLLDVKTPFDFILDDPSGNSFVENLNAPQPDPKLEISFYNRNEEQDRLLGILNEHSSNEYSALNDDETGETVPSEELIDEVHSFNTNCSQCNAPVSTNMKVTKIPHFKEVVIMATSCDACGNRTREVKSGSGIESLGKKIILKLTEIEDLKRDVLKSETCSIKIPELDLEVGPHALGGRYTTVEGLLVNMKEQLQDNNPMITGDSSEPFLKARLNEFTATLDEVINGHKKVTLILDDPCGNSYLQMISELEPDFKIEVIKYERTFDQNEELGLNDMKTENYETS